MSEKKTFAWSLEENAECYRLWVDLPGADGRATVRGRRLILTSAGRECAFVLPDDADGEHPRIESARGELRITLPRRAEYQKSA